MQLVCSRCHPISEMWPLTAVVEEETTSAGGGSQLESRVNCEGEERYIYTSALYRVACQLTKENVLKSRLE